MKVYDLRTLKLVNPLGIEQTPAFSWKLSSDTVDAQTAYRIIVTCAGTTFWDSGKRKSDDQHHVIYEGPSLTPRTRYEWQVTVYDKNDTAVQSDTAFFETGMCGTWSAKWIGHTCNEYPLDGASWIWGKNGGNTAAFTKAFTPKGRVVQALFDGISTWAMRATLNGEPIAVQNPGWGQTHEWPFHYVDITEHLKDGENVFYVDLFSADKEGAFIAKLSLRYEDGTVEEFVTDRSWEGAVVLGSFGDEPWGKVRRGGRAPILKKMFASKDKVKDARMYVSGLGYYDMTLNGRRVSDHVLTPSFTCFDKHVQYETFDVTDMLDMVNTIEVELGCGFYAYGKDWVGTAPGGEDRRMIMELYITYQDGSTEIIKTDESWLAADGARINDSVMNGEKYDARLEETINFGPVDVLPAPKGELVSMNLPPIRITQTHDCELIGTPGENVYLYDAHINTAGWAQFTFDAPEGTTIKIYYAERLFDNKINIGYSCEQFWDQMQTDIYVCKKGGVQIFEPRFSYKGFQYIQVQGAKPLAVKARTLHSDVDQIGDFKSSCDLFNKIHAMVQNTFLNNLHSIPTDTPMHEKRGWTGDGQVFCESAVWGYDMENFFEKWVQDMVDTQAEDGRIGHVAPGDTGYAPTPAWMSALVIVPWTLYRYYGDKHILEKHYDAFTKYMNYEINRLEDYKSWDQSYSDWCSPGTTGPAIEGGTLLATAYVYHLCDYMEQIANLLGHPDDAARYREVGSKVKDKINRDFMTEDGIYFTEKEAGYRQTSNLLPLAFGITEDNMKDKVFDNLQKDVAITHYYHLNTGCYGTKLLAPVLCDFGREDIAFCMAQQTTYPSWGDWIVRGKTTLMEGWDSETTRSLGHYFLGTIFEWFYMYVAGIKQTSPAYKTVQIKPYLGNTTWANASVETVYGKLSVSWEKAGNDFVLTAEIPVGITATVILPDGKEYTCQNGTHTYKTTLA